MGLKNRVRVGTGLGSKWKEGSHSRVHKTVCPVSRSVVGEWQAGTGLGKRMGRTSLRRGHGVGLSPAGNGMLRKDPVFISVILSLAAVWRNFRDKAGGQEAHWRATIIVQARDDKGLK